MIYLCSFCISIDIDAVVNVHRYVLMIFRTMGKLIVRNKYHSLRATNKIIKEWYFRITNPLLGGGGLLSVKQPLNIDTAQTTVGIPSDRSQVLMCEVFR